MKIKLHSIVHIFSISALCSLFTTQIVNVDAADTYGDPRRFEKDIQAFKNADKTQNPPNGAIVCIGSSSMRGWHDNIKSDLSPLTIIPRGFGGSNMNDALYYADEIVIPYKPRAVVVYEGDNDIAQGIAPERIRDTFITFVDKIHAHYPGARVYFISIKPSPSRWELWQEMKQANKLIAEVCSNAELLTYIDVASEMLDSEGEPKADIFLEDELHMNRKGYLIWRTVLRPILLEKEISFEKK
ncbi:MAG: hypothetical protein K9N48_05885 [Verrucomicrobia bacterium]|nr:hypothetical protein [Verrucomicrobiota bacterium]MCF7708722.1 hypothetical protein [Verrucomicrobiota bacterium]